MHNKSPALLIFYKFNSPNPTTERKRVEGKFSTPAGKYFTKYLQDPNSEDYATVQREIK